MGWIPGWSGLWMVLPSVSAPNFVSVTPSMGTGKNPDVPQQRNGYRKCGKCALNFYLAKWSKYCQGPASTQDPSSQLEAEKSGRYIINIHTLLFGYKLTGNFSRLKVSLSFSFSALFLPHSFIYSLKLHTFCILLGILLFSYVLFFSWTLILIHTSVHSPFTLSHTLFFIYTLHTPHKCTLHNTSHSLFTNSSHVLLMPLSPFSCLSLLLISQNRLKAREIYII